MCIRDSDEATCIGVAKQVKQLVDEGIQVAIVTLSLIHIYTLMLMLMAIRKMKRIMQKAEINDFSLPGIQGGELHNFTVGVLGTGRIGRAVIRDLSGFGCRIYAYDAYENEEVKKYAQYADCLLYTSHDPFHFWYPGMY